MRQRCRKRASLAVIFSVVAVLVAACLLKLVSVHRLLFSGATGQDEGRKGDTEAAAAAADLQRQGEMQMNGDEDKSDDKDGITLVIAHYDEWLADKNVNGTSDAAVNAPKWADPMSPLARNYDIYPLYQRLDSTKARYVPNNGYEAGAYIKFVVDNYNRLPEVVVFVQADACGLGATMEMTMSRLSVNLVREMGGYLPLNCGPIDRDFGLWRGRKPMSSNGSPEQLTTGRRVEDCFRHIASDFDRHDLFDGVPYSTWGPGYDPANETAAALGLKLRFICCACFAVTRQRIRQAASHAVWKGIYERAIVKGECVPGRKDLDRGKHELGGAFEHLAHVIWGGHEAYWKEPVCLRNDLKFRITVKQKHR